MRLDMMWSATKLWCPIIDNQSITSSKKLSHFIMICLAIMLSCLWYHEAEPLQVVYSFHNAALHQISSACEWLLVATSFGKLKRMHLCGLIFDLDTMHFFYTQTMRFNYPRPRPQQSAQTSTNTATTRIICFGLIQLLLPITDSKARSLSAKLLLFNHFRC